LDVGIRQDKIVTVSSVTYHGPLKVRDLPTYDWLSRASSYSLTFLMAQGWLARLALQIYSKGNSQNICWSLKGMCMVLMGEVCERSKYDE
jgi:hypothetical protein